MKVHALSWPRPCPDACHLQHHPPYAAPPTPAPVTHLTLFSSLPAATLAGRLCSGRPNSGSREDSKGRASHRLERCEVRGVGKVLCPWMPAALSACVSLLDQYLTEGSPDLCLMELSQISAHSPRQPLVTCSYCSFSLPRPPHQSQLVYTAPRFLSPCLPPHLHAYLPHPCWPSSLYSADRGISLKCKSDPGTCSA